MKLKKLSKKWLLSKNACPVSIEAFSKQSERNPLKVIELLIKTSHWDWGNWLITRMMTKRQCVQYAIYAAEQVINIFEQKYPYDTRPRKAIEAASLYLKSPVARAADAAYAAAYDAYAAYDADAAYARAADAAYAAAYAADAAYAAARDADAAYAAAYAADYAAYAYLNLKYKMIRYGVGLLKEKSA